MTNLERAAELYDRWQKLSFEIDQFSNAPEIAPLVTPQLRKEFEYGSRLYRVPVALLLLGCGVDADALKGRDVE